MQRQASPVGVATRTPTRPPPGTPTKLPFPLTKAILPTIHPKRSPINEIRAAMQSVRTWSVCLCLLLSVLTGAGAQTFDFKSVKLSADQRASLKRHLTNSLPELSFDWNSLEAHSQSVGRKRAPLSVTLSTVPALTTTGICRSEQRHFHLEAAAGKGKGRWQANDDLTSRYAWTAPGGDCTSVSSPIAVGKSLTDAEFLFIDRQKDTLRSRAAQVIGGSDCARVRFCEVTLRRIHRVRQDDPPRTLTRLTYSPVKPGPACLYVMEVSFVGPLNDLAPLGASCPKP